MRQNKNQSLAMPAFFVIAEGLQRGSIWSRGPYANMTKRRKRLAARGPITLRESEAI
jgi:hypothetical protein